jgi:hypothetical protein
MPHRQTTMNRAAFLEAAARRDVDPAAAAALYDDLYGSPSVSRLGRSLARFDDQTSLSRVVQVLIWLGTGLLIGAHAWWSTRGYEALGAGAVLALTLAFQLAYLAAAEWARRRGFRSLVAGFAAIAAFYTPLTAYSAERLLGFHFRGEDFHDFYPYLSGGWIWMELASIAVAALLLAYFRRPFLMLPLTLFTAFLAVDGTTRFAGGWQHHRLVEFVALGCSLVLLAVGIVLDHHGWRRFAFWPHLTAASTGICSTELLCGHLYTLGLFLCAAAVLTVGVWLARATHLALGAALGWGAIGSSGSGALLPFFLSVGGLGFVALAIWLARVDSPLRRWLASRELPAPQRDLAF